MSIDPTRLAAASGLIGKTAQAAKAPNLDGVTSLKKDGGGTDVFGLGKDDFFKLFLAQLKNQDPTQPLDDKEFLAQLAQFTMIDTLEQVKSSLGGTQLAQASALIGDQVIGTDTSGLPADGIVDRIVQDSTRDRARPRGRADRRARQRHAGPLRHGLVHRIHRLQHVGHDLAQGHGRPAPRTAASIPRPPTEPGDTRQCFARCSRRSPASAAIR